MKTIFYPKSRKLEIVDVETIDIDTVAEATLTTYDAYGSKGFIETLRSPKRIVKELTSKNTGRIVIVGISNEDGDIKLAMVRMF